MTFRELLISLLLFSPVALAGGKLTDLQIDKEVVIFSTTQIKPLPNLACVANDAADKWTASLKTESGRAIYSLLVTALSKNLALEVSGAGDCADKDGIERSEGVKLLMVSTPVVSQAKTVGMYKADGVTRIGTVINIVRNNEWYYADQAGVQTAKNYYLKNDHIYFSEVGCKGIALGDGSKAVRHSSYNGGRFYLADTSSPSQPIKSQMDHTGHCSDYRNSIAGFKLIEGEDPLCGANTCLIKEDK